MFGKLTILTDPKGKGRPRFTRNGRPYTPASTRDYERIIRDAYRRQKLPLHTGGVVVALDFRRAIPASWTKAKQQLAMDGELECITKPDLDNLIKACMDALNGVAWADDKQVVGLIATKGYAEQASVTIEIKEKDDARD